MECMAREFGHYSEDQREEFLKILKKKKGWEERLQKLEALIATLKAEGRYEKELWKEKAKLNASSW